MGRLSGAGTDQRIPGVVDIDPASGQFYPPLDLDDPHVFARVGNWLSWGDQTYPREASEKDPVPATRDEILARGTLYKVGHHCSHNTTLREFGLEKMISPRPMAMIPVVESVAKQNDGNMPFPDLFNALLERTRGRVVTGDGAPEKERESFTNLPGDTPYPVKIEHAEDGLWVEVMIDYETGRH